jgi:hypothetical protein
MAKQTSDVPRVTPAPANLFTTRRSAFIWLALLLIALAILRSAMATRLDGFTIDEAYHIAAGVSYVKYHDFRINPEHPPLVKLWVGTVIHATGFRLDSLRQFNGTRMTQRQKKRFLAPSSSTRRPTSFTFSSEIST